jgi:PEP-CTERM motif
MGHAIRSFTVAACLLAVASAAQAVFTVEVTRFGVCLEPPGGCVFDIADNSALDLNPAPSVIDFALPVVGQAPSTFASTGRAIETVTRDRQGRVTSILLQLTDTTVRGLAGTGTGGQIGLVSSVPLTSVWGVSGFASLDGEYRSFAGGVIDHANLMLQARLGGLLLGLVDPPAVDGAPSPTPFAGFDSRAWNLPVSNLLFAVFDFQVSPDSGFVLPDSGEAFARAIPEPATPWLMALGVVALLALRRPRRPPT